MGEEAQISVWALYAYGWLCLFFCIVSLSNAVSNEVSEKTHAARWAPRRASWASPVLCLLMAEVAWYMARVFG